MSRCFPFPPPGYEKTVRPDGQLASNLLDKERDKEKKHKKDKDKKEGKEKKEKERSKDKHRDKKDRKEKHKDKKKDKSKDKSRESEEGTERHGKALNDQKFGESSKKAEEIRDLKFREDLVRRTQDEKGAENRSVENFAVSNDRSREGIAAPALENERTTVNKMRIHSISASRKNESLGQPSININQQKNGTAVRRVENFNSSSQRTPDGSNTAPAMEKERIKVTRPPYNSTDSAPRTEGMGQRISNISIVVQKRTESPSKEIVKKEIGTSSPLLPSPANTVHKGNGKVGRPMDNASASMQRFDSPSTSCAATGMDRGTPRSTIPSPSITIRRPNGMARPPESLSFSAKKPDAGGLSPAMGKEKEQAGRMLQTNVSTDQKLVNSKTPVVEKIAVGTAERMEKARDGAPDVAKKESKKSDRHEKKKRKDKDKHREKKKEKEAKKEIEQHKHKEHDKIIENSIISQIDNIHTKPLARSLVPPADDAKGILADENLKKRNNHEMNGYLQNHHDMRPTKLPRPAPSSNHVENGTASHVAAPLSSVKPEAINIEKAERLHRKEEKINGNKEAQRPSVDSGLRDPLAASENGTPPRKSPHPDCKYLGQIYCIPEAPQMMECEHDDQDWLFNQGGQSEKPKPGTEVDGAPQVWAEALKIDQADVIALPYVIPF